MDWVNISLGFSVSGGVISTYLIIFCLLGFNLLVCFPICAALREDAFIYGWTSDVSLKAFHSPFVMWK